MRLIKKLETVFDSLKLREKIIGLFVFCVIIPLIMTDGIILNRIVSGENAQNLHDSQNIAVAVQTMLAEIGDNCEKITTSVSMNQNVEEFLGDSHKTGYDYFDQYYRMTSNSFFQTLVGFNNTKVKLYSDNDSMVNGGYVGRIDKIRDMDWYTQYKKKGEDRMIGFFFDESKSVLESNRVIYFVKKLTFPNNEFENFIQVEVDYSTTARKLINMGYDKAVYVVQNGKVLLTNKGMNNLGDPYEDFKFRKQIGYKRDINLYGDDYSIIVLKDDTDAMYFVKKNIGVIILLIIINLLLPAILMAELNRSIIHRIQKLDQAFKNVDQEEITKIDNPQGNDEIGELMVNYNRMADRTNELIQIVYKDRLEEQEMSIAKQNAELLALHSQINPHFMFNALESIRMHSVIKGESETAEMVEKLAIMERQYVDWGSDMIEIEQEMNSVEAYLGLQKYRFGDRLMFELNVDDDCTNIKVPKLTIVTFVENACVHGIESKSTSCWVFVRVYKKDGNIVIEVEDTGNGMDEDMLEYIQDKAKDVTIEDLKSKHHVGILNALLRLRMISHDKADFYIESEDGVGTIVQITIPQEEI